jgi:hypothetical protein
MMLRKVGVISETSNATAEEVSIVAAALQVQVLEHFAPLWGIPATVSHFPTVAAALTSGHWPIIVRDDIGTDATGVHRDKNSQPFALVRHAPGWPLTASHECLEMLADPSFNMLVPAQSLRTDQGQVEFLVEVCDPCQDGEFAYLVNNVMLSDFCTPSYYNDSAQMPGARYSFRGHVTAPRQVLKGGYISWHDPETDHWWRMDFDGVNRFFFERDTLDPGTEGLRATLDRLANIERAERYPSLAAAAAAPDESRYLGSASRQDRALKGAYMTADLLHTHIDSLLGRSGKPAPNTSSKPRRKKRPARSR